jgi:hypothetical protein
MAFITRPKILSLSPKFTSPHVTGGLQTVHQTGTMHKVKAGPTGLIGPSPRPPVRPSQAVEGS